MMMMMGYAGYGDQNGFDGGVLIVVSMTMEWWLKKIDGESIGD